MRGRAANACAARFVALMDLPLLFHHTSYIPIILFAMHISYPIGARGLIRLLVLIFFYRFSHLLFSLYVLFLLFVTILHDPA